MVPRPVDFAQCVQILLVHAGCFAPVERGRKMGRLTVVEGAAPAAQAQCQALLPLDLSR